MYGSPLKTVSELSSGWTVSVSNSASVPSRAVRKVVSVNNRASSNELP